MNVGVETYSPDEVMLIFGGYMIEGWDSITVERVSQEFKTVRGIKGSNTRVRNKNSHSTIKISCPQTSPLNEVFSSIVALDEQTGNGRLEVSLINGTGWESFSSIDAYIVGESSRGYTKDLSAREWTIECLSSKWDGGGRKSLIGSIIDSAKSLLN